MNPVWSRTLALAVNSPAFDGDRFAFVDRVKDTDSIEDLSAEDRALVERALAAVGPG